MTSFAEDAVQETMTRAWRRQEQFEGRSSLRTWLFRIATNVCIDLLRGRARRAIPMDLESPSSADGLHVPAPLPPERWVLPVPDAWAVPAEADPADQAISRESIRLAFVAALQHLTPRQRAILILRDVLQFSAIETADLLGTTVSSANSALQRARAALPTAAPAGAAAGQPGGAPGRATPTGRAAATADQKLLDDYVAAFEAYDIPRLTSLLCADAIQSMPPFSLWLRGPADIGKFMLGPGAECQGSRLLRTRANGCAAVGQYRSDGAGGHTPWAIAILETSGGQVTEQHFYVMMPELFRLFGFPPKL
jgi:RNA polymerase sigma-70 factor (ECF subfamily)